MEITVGEAIVRFLETEGVKYIFGVPGSHILPLFDAIHKSQDIQFILTKHECGAAFMAMNYTKVSGKIAVCVVTAGPGVTNLITGVAEAYKASIPIITISGQTPIINHAKNAMQEDTGETGSYSSLQIMRSITKMSSVITHKDKVIEKLKEAFRIALSGRCGPVHLTIPTNILLEEILFEPVSPSSYRLVDYHGVDIKKIKEAALLLKESKRPVIIVGSRTIFPNCSNEIYELSSSMKIPVIATASAKGVLEEGDLLCLGCLDLFGHKIAERYVKGADMVIAIGEDFGEYATIYWDPEMIKKDALIQIDCDPYEIGKVYPARLGIVGDIKNTVIELIRELDRLNYTSNIELEEISKLKEEEEYFREKDMFLDAIPMKPQQVIHIINKTIPTESIVLSDIGNHGFWLLRYFQVVRNLYFVSYGAYSMGQSVAGCIGAKLAAQERPVICICGDGGFQMNGMDVATAVQYDIDVTWIIFNDSRLNAIYLTQSATYGDLDYCCTMKNPDFSKLATAYGINGYKASTPIELSDALHKAIMDEKPSIVEVFYDRDEYLPVKPRSLLLMKEQGIMKGLHNSPMATKAFMKILKERCN